MMRVQDVRDARRRMRLSIREFASVMGVSPSTVGRWESARERTIAPDPASERLLAAFAAVPAGAAGRVGTAVREALRLSGSLKALYVLLKHLYEETTDDANE